MLLVVAGVAARLRHLATNRSLWLDESLLSLNILFVPWERLFGKLAHAQVAPPGFLVLVRAVARVLGPKDWVLRLVPFVAGCVALPVTWAIAKRIAGPTAALVALAIVAACPEAIYFAGEVKPYSVDLLATAALLLVAARHREVPDDPGRARALLAAGVIAPWFSLTSAFVLAEIGLALALETLVRGEWARVRPLARLAIGWIGSFALLWAISLSRSSGNAWLQEFWQAKGCFPPPRAAAAPGWMLSAMVRIMSNPVGLPYPGYALAVVAAGLGLLLGGTRRFWGVSFALLLAIALAAATLRFMPLCERLAVYLVPVAALSIATVVGAIFASAWASTTAGRWLVRVAATAFLVAAANLYPWQRVLHPAAIEHLRPVLEVLAREWRPGDNVVVHFRAWPAFQLYSRTLHLPVFGAQRFGEWSPSATHPVVDGWDAVLARLPVSGRTWYVAVHRSSAERNVQRANVAALERRGVRLRSIEQPGARAGLYDLRPPTPQDPSSGSVDFRVDP